MQRGLGVSPGEVQGERERARPRTILLQVGVDERFAGDGSRVDEPPSSGFHQMPWLTMLLSLSVAHYYSPPMCAQRCTRLWLVHPLEIPHRVHLDLALLSQRQPAPCDRGGLLCRKVLRTGHHRPGEVHRAVHHPQHPLLRPRWRVGGRVEESPPSRPGLGAGQARQRRCREGPACHRREWAKGRTIKDWFSLFPVAR